MTKLLPALMLGLAAAAAPLRAAVSGATAVEERFKAAVNAAVAEVRSHEDAAGKRRALESLCDRMDTGLGKALASGSLSEQDRSALETMQGRFSAWGSELRGEDGGPGVADADLEAFADYVQQDLEQAPVGGGIYISAGALIIILLLLLILT